MIRLALLLPFAALPHCQKDESVAAYGAADREWVLQSIDGMAFPARATLEFLDDGNLAGDAPCNRFSGQLDAPYPWFEIHDLVASRSACPELEAEGTYFAALMAMTQSEVSGSVMILRNDAGHELVFKAAD